MLQAKESIAAMTFQMDQDTINFLETLDKTTKALMNIRVSQSVFLRRAIQLYVARMLEIFVDGHKAAEKGSVVDRLELVSKLIDQEKQALMACSKRKP